MFLNAEKPISSCRADTCDGCAVNHAIHCHFTWKDLVHFLLISLPPFLLGGAGIYHQSGWLLVYGMTTAGFFITMTNFLCVQCMNFACPLNRVEEDRRNEFFKQNPIVGKAWGKESSAESRTRSESVP